MSATTDNGGGAGRPVVGVIGGSGLYDVAALQERDWRRVTTPWGDPSDALLAGTIAGTPCLFLPRHGRGHRIPPSDLNFRANIAALKAAGATHVLSVSAVGSLREDLPPGRFVLPDQFIDRTFARAKSFFGPGLVAHVSLADPVCDGLGRLLAEAAADAGIPITRGGTYLVMEGPQFSTRAESELYRSWGCSVIGMTNMPEAKLAREAELHYATVAMVTDYDCWHQAHDHVTVDAVVAVMRRNAEVAARLIEAAIPRIGAQWSGCAVDCGHALEHALITAPDARDAAMTEKLRTVAGRVL